MCPTLRMNQLFHPANQSHTLYMQWEMKMCSSVCVPTRRHDNSVDYISHYIFMNFSEHKFITVVRTVRDFAEIQRRRRQTLVAHSWGWLMLKKTMQPSVNADENWSMHIIISWTINLIATIHHVTCVLCLFRSTTWPKPAFKLTLSVFYLSWTWNWISEYYIMKSFCLSEYQSYRLFALYYLLFTVLANSPCSVLYK